MSNNTSFGKQLQIGTVHLENPICSAPMSGITDKPFRMVMEEFHCGLIFTEMISVNALAYDSERTKRMFDLTGERGPTAVQIFGSDPDRMASAAKTVENAGAAIVDINMGCPAPKVVKNLEGSALMTNLPLAQKIIEAVVQAVSIPVTVKMRKGWDNSCLNAIELAHIAETCGASAVTIHGRTRDQFYAGHADWEYIRLVKAKVKIPVIGNGDVKEPNDALRMMEQTGCDGVMIGRSCLGNPWLIKRTVELLNGIQMTDEPAPLEKMLLAKHHLKLAIEMKGEGRGIREMRKHLAWYMKGLKGSAHVKELVNRAPNEEELTRLVDEYTQYLTKSDMNFQQPE